MQINEIKSAVTAGTRKYHPKTPFALFLNQAINNADIAFKDAIPTLLSKFPNDVKLRSAILNIPDETFKKIEKNYFRFLLLEKKDKTAENEITKKKELFCNLYCLLSDIRNYFSHFYHFDTPLFIENSEIRDYLKNKFSDAKDALLKDYQVEEIEHIKPDDKNYMFFHELKDNSINKYRIDRNNKAIVFLASFFLDKRQCNLMLDKIKGFKKAFDKQSQATRDVFLHFHMKSPDSEFVSENTNVSYFVDSISHLNKILLEVFEHLDNNVLKLKITMGTYNRIKNQIIQNEYDTEQVEKKESSEKKYKKDNKKELARKKLVIEIDKLNEMEGKEFTNTKEFLIEVELKIGSQNTNKYKEIIINHALENNYNLRTTKDRFTLFALQFIDDFNLLPNIRFRVYTGYESKEDEIKVYHSKKTFERKVIKRETIYCRINDRRKEDIENDRYYSYFIKDNNVFFEANTPKFGKLKGSISVHEIRNLVFALIQENHIEEELIKLLEQYAQLYKDIKDGIDKIEIKKKLEIDEKYLPEYLQKWMQGKKYNNADFQKDVVSKLSYNIEFAKEYIKDGFIRLKNLRKFEKIREILNFVNRNVPKYIDVDQYEEMEILLGTFPKSREEMLKYLKINEINATCITSKKVFVFDDMVKVTVDLDNLMQKTLEATIKWSEEKIKNIQQMPDPDFLKTVAKIINVSPKEYSEKRINENITKFLEKNIIIPRGFIINSSFYKNIKDKENISKQIIDRCAEMSLSEFYDKVDNYKNDFEKYKSFGKLIDDLKTKDKLLLLMAQNYLEKKIVPNSSAIGFELKTKIKDVLKGEIIINRFGKNIKFGIREYNQIINVLNDKRLEKILNVYCPAITDIYFVNRIKYENKEKQKSESEKNELVHDLQDALHKIEREQLEVVDLTIKLEKQTLIELIQKSCPEIPVNFIEFIIDDLEKPKLEGTEKEKFLKFQKQNITKIQTKILPLLKENRIETKMLLEKAGMKDAGIDGFLKNHRNKAFHNDLPTSGTFQDGIDFIKEYIKN